MQFFSKPMLIALMLILLDAAFPAMSNSFANLTQIDTEQGLNQSEISGLMQDSEGYLWISSNQGINRFDGYRVSTIQSPNDILLNNYVELMFEDSYGLIWIGAAPQNSYILDKKANLITPIVFEAPAEIKLEYPMINRIIEDPLGNLWVATYQQIFFFDRQTKQLTYVATIDSLFENAHFEHSIRDLLLLDHQLLVATSNGLYALDINTHLFLKIHYSEKTIDSKDQINVKKLHLNDQGNLLVGTVEGLYQIDRVFLNNLSDNSGNIGRTIISNLNIWELIEEDSFYWVATNLGLFKYYKSGELELIFKYSDTKYNTSDDNIVAMLKDREGNLWFGSRSDGLFKWHPNESIKAHYWSNALPTKQVSNDQIYAIERSVDGNIWFGTENGLNQLNPLNGTISPYLVNPDKKAVVSESSIYDIHANQRKLWLSTGTGIRVFDIDKKIPFEIIFPASMQELFKKPIYSLYFFDSDNLALINEDGIYNYHLPTNSIGLVESTKNKKTSDPQFIQLFSTATGERETYFLAVEGSLVKYSRGTGKIQKFHQLPQGDSNLLSPSALYRDRDQLWVSYAGYGVFLLNANTGKEIQVFLEKDLQAQTIMDIFPDDFGNLWFTSNNGLLRMNKTDYHSRVFDMWDGFATSEFNGNTKLALDDGEVMLGSVKGVFHVNPNLLKKKKRENIQAHITGVRLLSRSIPYQYADFDNYQLDFYHDDFGLKLEFSALLFDKPNQVKYRYWLEGDSSTEPRFIDKSELLLPSFNTGKIHLKVSAIDYETGKESDPVSIFITAYPAPWFSNVALSSYLFLAIMILSIYFYRYKKREDEKKIAHQSLQHSEERLKLALQGGNSGLWDWHVENDLVYEPRLSCDAFAEEHVCTFEQRLAAVHSDDRELFRSTWKKFLSGDEEIFDHQYRMIDDNSNWAWYRDMATVSKRDFSGKAIRVTGTYTDVSKRKLERDQMRLYSKAFENTRDIVFVLNENKEMMAANQAFIKTTNLAEVDILNKSIDCIVDVNDRSELIENIYKSIRQTSLWQGEGKLIIRNSHVLPVLINATRFKVEAEAYNYVFALTDISSQKIAEAELRKLASYDGLTGLPNRTLLLDRMKHAIDHCKRRHQRIAVFFIDLDRFKRINDTLGHDIGDLLLINVAKLLKRSVREDDTVARLGGDEFVVILEDIESLDAINHIAQDIVEVMKKPLVLKDNQIAVSPSIGISIYPTDGDDADALLKHADIAMYHAKKAGRNNFQYFQASMNQTAKNRLSLENKLRLGLLNNEFYLTYQPQYDLVTGKLCGMESLARWTTSEGEVIPPDEFIPLAEDLGLIITMSEILLTQAIENLSRWHKSGYPISLAFNLSAKHLQHYDLNQFLDRLVINHPVNLHLLEFELTESVLLEDAERVKSLFTELATKGVALALDDFGTGYSCLKYLSQLPIKKIKIDRAFVSRIGKDLENEAIICTIISLAKSLNLKTVAEGIETQQQLDFLQHAGADITQGIFFSKPVNLSEMNAILIEMFD